MFRTTALLLLAGSAAANPFVTKLLLLRGETALREGGPIPPSVLECLQNTEEESCNSAVDEDGHPCDWCNTMVGVGLCMSGEAAEMAEEFEPLFQCDGDEGEYEMDPELEECLVKEDSDSCDDDTACDWCSTPFGDAGACLSIEYAEKAKQLVPLVTCDSALMNLKDDPDDLMVCLEQADQSSCDSTVDDDGNSCAWCSTAIGGLSACLSSTYADMAKQFEPLITCDGDDGEGELEDPIVPPQLLECLENLDDKTCSAASDEDGNACGWCNTMAGVGVCLSGDFVDVAKQFEPFINCDGAAIEVPSGIMGPYDPLCVFAGYSGGGKAGCEGALDMDSAPCVWCTIPTEEDQGLCLNQDQANYAQEFMECEDPDMYATE